jgi:hypothetical protein
MAATEFEAAALQYRVAVMTCWTDRTASAASWVKGCRSIEAACAYHWLGDGPHYWVLMLELGYAEHGFLEAGNPNDPSYGRWGTTLEAARWVHRVLDVPMPSSDTGLRRKLEEDDAFAALCAMGELKLCLIRSNGRTERAVIRYNLGAGADLTSRLAIRRLKHWREIVRAWTCTREHTWPCTCL